MAGESDSVLESDREKPLSGLYLLSVGLEMDSLFFTTVASKLTASLVVDTTSQLDKISVS